jgi:hypothetical protein
MAAGGERSPKQRFHETDQLGALVVVPAKPPKGGAEPGSMDTELDVITDLFSGIAN